MGWRWCLRGRGSLDTEETGCSACSGSRSTTNHLEHLEHPEHPEHLLHGDPMSRVWMLVVFGITACTAASRESSPADTGAPAQETAMTTASGDTAATWRSLFDG